MDPSGGLARSTRCAVSDQNDPLEDALPVRRPVPPAALVRHSCTQSCPRDRRHSSGGLRYRARSRRDRLPSLPRRTPRRGRLPSRCGGSGTDAGGHCSERRSSLVRGGVRSPRGTGPGGRDRALAGRRLGAGRGQVHHTPQGCLRPRCCAPALGPARRRTRCARSRGAHARSGLCLRRPTTRPRRAVQAASRSGSSGVSTGFRRNRRSGDARDDREAFAAGYCAGRPLLHSVLVSVLRALHARLRQPRTQPRRTAQAGRQTRRCPESRGHRGDPGHPVRLSAHPSATDCPAGGTGGSRSGSRQPPGGTRQGNPSHSLSRLRDFRARHTALRRHAAL